MVFGDKSYSGIGAYGSSKLCNALFAASLNKEVHACSLHPGTMVSTSVVVSPTYLNKAVALSVLLYRWLLTLAETGLLLASS